MSDDYHIKLQVNRMRDELNALNNNSSEMKGRFLNKIKDLEDRMQRIEQDILDHQRKLACLYTATEKIAARLTIEIHPAVPAFSEDEANSFLMGYYG